MEVKDLLAYLRVVANPADEVSLERIVNKPTRGIGDSTYEKCVEKARAERRTVFDAMRQIAAPQMELLATGPKKKLAGFVALVDELRAHVGPVAKLAETILERTQYLERLAADSTHESQERIENLMELVGSMRDWETEEETVAGTPPTLTAYLERVSLVSPADEKPKGVTLMTVHAAKGLEFPVVFVTGLEDGVFPSLRDGDDEEAIEEERRLAYVAITRARQRLFLTNARARRLYGQDPRPFQESRFLADIPDACIARPVRPKPSWTRDSGPPPMARRIERESGISVEYDEPSYDEAPFHLGQRVRHATYGEGEVRGLTGFGRDLKLTVYFPSVGPKTIVARFIEAV
jgi:DNA helicase-2/ATP-dependent DNA helicase PcrA